MKKDKKETLGGLIKQKGILKYFVHRQLKNNGIKCNEATFSRWCTGSHKPKNKSVARVLAEILNEKEEFINQLIS